MKTKIDLANLKKMPQADYLNEVKSEFKRLKASGESEVIVITDFTFADGKKGSVVIPTDISGTSQKFYNDVAKKEYKGFGRGTVNLKDGEQGTTMELFIDSGKAKAKALEKGGKKIFEKVGVIPVITKNPAALAEEDPDTAEDAASNESAATTANNESATTDKSKVDIDNLKTGADDLKAIQTLVKGELVAILARANAQKTLETDAAIATNISQKINSWLEWFNLLKPNEQKQFEVYVPQLNKIQTEIKRINLTQTNEDGVLPGVYILHKVGKDSENRKADVITVKELLKKHGANTSKHFKCDEATIAAIMDFQKAQNLEVNGVVEPQSKTWYALIKAGKIDDAVGQKEGHTFKYSEFALNLFRSGSTDGYDIHPNDIAQGRLGNCYFLAALSAVAQSNPEAIRNLIKDNGDGSYDVTLYAKDEKLAFQPTIITVKPQFPVNGIGEPVYAGKGDNELWVMIMEKAYAKLIGNYDEIVSGKAENGLEAILGTETTEYYFQKYSKEKIIWIIIESLKGNLPITASSSGKGEEPITIAPETIVYGGHAYSIVEINTDKKTILLRNPWGKSHLLLTFGEFFTYFFRITSQYVLKA